ncbi:MAG: hypothetical protein QW128_06180 [Thermoprotei archaeon]
MNITNEQTMDLIIESFSSLVGKNSKIVIAYDGSNHALLKTNLIVAALNSFGISTINLGLGSLSLISYVIKKLNLDGGIMVSNNITIIDRFGIPLCEKDLSESTPELVSWNMIGKQSSFDADFYYVEDMLVNSSQLLTSSNLTANIVIDLYGGGLSKTAPEILRLTGSRLTTLNAIPNNVSDDRTLEDATNDILTVTKSWEADIGLLFSRDGNKLWAVIKDSVITGKDLVEMALEGLRSTTIFSSQPLKSQKHKIIIINTDNCSLQYQVITFLRWKKIVAYIEDGVLSNPLTGFPDPIFTSMCLLAAKPWLKR